MKKIIFIIFFLPLITSIAFAREKEFLVRDTLSTPFSLGRTNIECYFRGNFFSDNPSLTHSSTHFQFEDTWLNLQGDYNKALSYQVRFRLNRPLTITDLDNTTVGLDYAYLLYRLGKNRQWEITIGKQCEAIGSYELTIHPLYEYIYGDYLNYVVNPFVAGAKVEYTFNNTQKIGFQLHNTLNESFHSFLEKRGFISPSLLPSKLPIGGLIYWKGEFGDHQFKTHYSYDLSQFAQGKYTHTFSLGNWLEVGKHLAYLDLYYAYMEADYGLLSSKILSQYEGRTPGNYEVYENTVYKGLISRYEYQITPLWSASAKGGIEFLGSRNSLNEHFRTHYIYALALQYAPFGNTDFRVHLAYIGKTVSYIEELKLPEEQLHRFSLGASYTLPVIKREKVKSKR